jgi:hypothetical protein
MGTSCTCACTTIYCSFHEETRLLLNPNILLYGHLLDDASVVLCNAPGTYEHFVSSMNDFGPKGKCTPSVRNIIRFRVLAECLLCPRIPQVIITTGLWNKGHSIGKACSNVLIQAKSVAKFINFKKPAADIFRTGTFLGPIISSVRRASFTS